VHCGETFHFLHHYGTLYSKLNVCILSILLTRRFFFLVWGVCTLVHKTLHINKEGGSRQQHLNVTFSAKTAPTTPVGVGLPARQRPHLSRTNSCGIGASPPGTVLYYVIDVLRVNWSSWFKLFLLQNFMNIVGMIFFSSKSFPLISAGTNIY
jgi:hypothetical protein